MTTSTVSGNKYRTTNTVSVFQNRMGQIYTARMYSTYSIRLQGTCNVEILYTLFFPIGIRLIYGFRIHILLNTTDYEYEYDYVFFCSVDNDVQLPTRSLSNIVRIP
jgi:hypothetical protein